MTLMQFMGSLAEKNKFQWKSTFGELLEKLEDLYPKAAQSDEWPKSPKGLSGQLQEVAPFLRQKEIHIERRGRTNTGSVVKLINMKEQQPSQQSQPSLTKVNISSESDVCDGGDAINQ